MSIDVSLIVVSFGDPEVLFNSLGRSNEHLKRADSLGYEIIIIDNFSSEEYRTAMVDRLKNYRDESTRFILNTKNLGFGASCNIGAREAKGKFLWFINPDAWIEDLSGIKSLLAFAEQEFVGAVTTKCTLNGQASAQVPRITMSPQYLFLSNLRIGRLFRQMKSNPYLNWIASVLSRFLSFSKSFREYNNSYSEVDQICETDVIGGSSFLVQRRLHILAGGFDEDYFLYDEDFDYCLRLKRFGKTNFIHPGAQVAMLVSGTVHQISARTIQRYKKRSRLLFINKNFKNPWKLLLSSQCKLLW